MNRPPSFRVEACSLADVRPLFEAHHAYKSTGRVCVYSFALIEDERPIAAFLWQPPPPNSAKTVCPALPHGVLALSRMVALPRDQRRYQHISRPLKWQMRNLIDRTRWPVLVTYSDESVGHTGYLYKCSGWAPTARNLTKTLTLDGARVSRYSDGRTASHEGAVVGEAWIQRWEQRVDGRDDAGCAALFGQHLGARADRQGLALREPRVHVRPALSRRPATARRDGAAAIAGEGGTPRDR